MTRPRLAVDIGGTFTDVAVERDGACHTGKVLTTPDDPVRGVLDGARLALARAGLAPGDVGAVIHGTTLATNALIERRGAAVGAIVTAGFRDILEIACERRYDQYDLYIEKPDTLVPRERVATVAERVSATGQVLDPLDPGSVHRAVDALVAGGVESIAVCLLHSYVNPAHEQAVGAAVERRAPGVAVSLSSEVSPEVREFDRLCTTVANAYVKPLMAGYLGNLARGLEAGGFDCPLFLMTSGGGMTTLDTARAFPIRLVESGPSGGAVLAARVARSRGCAEVLSFDMGGTTAKVCLIEDGEPRTSRAFEVGRAERFIKGSGLPVRIPVLEMIEIGAGGGSIASVDGHSRLRVGPRSASSDPGPACYGRGGEWATVTDADAVAGYLDPDAFAEGRLRLDLDLARRAVGREVGDRLRMDVAAGADGISQMVDEAMANAARMHAAEQGKSLEDCVMVAFGGNGPLHATRVAEKVGVGRIVVPPQPGAGSAVGFLSAPVSFEVVRSHYVRVAAPAAHGRPACMEQDGSSPVCGAGRGATMPAVAARSSGISAGPDVPAPAAHGHQARSSGVSASLEWAEAPARQGLQAPEPRGHSARMAEPDVAAVNVLLDAMREEATAVVRAGAGDAPLVVTRTAFMRYRGQGHEIEVAIPDGALDAGRVARLVAAFEADYARLFGRIVPGMALEVMNWSVRVSTPPEAAPRAGDCAARNVPEPAGTRTLALGQTGDETVAACFRRADLAPGDAVTGPALIVEPQTTTFVSPRFEARIDTAGNIVMTRREVGGREGGDGARQPAGHPARRGPGRKGREGRGGRKHPEATGEVREAEAERVGASGRDGHEATEPGRRFPERGAFGHDRTPASHRTQGCEDSLREPHRIPRAAPAQDEREERDSPGPAPGRRSAIDYEVMWTRLQAVVEEQAQVLIRTAFSPIVRECGDISAGIFAPDGRMLAQAVTGTPGHINTMAAAVGLMLAHVPLDTMQPGDVYTTNDPWMASGHLNDVLLVAPVFDGATPVALTACTSHLYDLGGLGMGPNGGDVHDEGLFIPPMKLVERGAVNAMLVRIFKANSRSPESNEGDLYALIACCEVGGRRLLEMMREFGLRDLDGLGAYVLDASNAAAKAAIAEVPNGVYRNRMTLDGYDFEIGLEATMTVSDDAIVTDFTGTSRCSRYGINVPLNYAAAYSVFGIRCLVGPDIPNNAGSLAPFVVRAPEGCILNAPFPAPVAMRHTIGQLTCDLVLGCLHQALPGRVPAEGASCMWDLPLRSAALSGLDADATTFAIELTHNGGTGARPGADGLSATGWPSGVWGSQVEVTESTVPVRVRRRELIPDSGGAGRQRGGLGQIIELESSEGRPIEFFASLERMKYPARGRAGGAAGRLGRACLRSGRRLAGKGEHTIPEGDRLVFETPGGGGYGDPRERRAEAVAADVARGLVSRESAERLYAVVLDEAGGLDAEATRARRLAAARSGGLAPAADSLSR